MEIHLLMVDVHVIKMIKPIIVEIIVKILIFLN